MPATLPYTYDEPGITYDEHCLLWNGNAFDSVCLNIGGKRVGGGRSTLNKELKPVNYPWVDITVTSRLLSVNDNKEENTKSVSQNVRGELRPGNISLVATEFKNSEHTLGFKVKSISPGTEGESYKLSNISVSAISLTQPSIIIKSGMPTITTGSK